MSQVRSSATIVARGPLAWESLEATAPRRWGRYLWPILVFVIVLSGANLTVPYFVLSPGGATPVNPLVAVPMDRAHPAQGRFLLTTVSLLGEPTLLQALTGWLDADVDVFPEEQILGTQTREQFREANVQDIDDSKDVAIAVALRRLGETVNITGTGVIVERILLPRSSAAALLRPGDVIVAAGGQPVSLVEDVQAAVSARQPGGLLPLDLVAPDGTRRSVEVGLVACPEGVECPTGSVVMGVGLIPQGQQFEWPFEVSIESQDIGGPSAGLAFTLTVIDLLTPGELTGGQTVAITGTIDLVGNVGPIGGVGQKAAAVTDMGVEIFLVPEANAAEAREHAGPDLTIVPVTDLESALTALGRIGGDLTGLGSAP